MLDRRHDVEHGELRYLIGKIERQAMGEAGAAVMRDDPVTGMAQGVVDLFFLGTMGVKLGYGTYARDVAAGHDLRQHAASFTLEVRPLFLPLLLTNRFTGNKRLDLFLYSIGLDVGFSFERTSISGPLGGADDRLGFHLGLGFEVPLWHRAEHALFLRFQVRANFAPSTPLRAELSLLAGRTAQTIDALQVGVLLRYRFQFWDRL